MDKKDFILELDTSFPEEGAHLTGVLMHGEGDKMSPYLEFRSHDGKDFVFPIPEKGENFLFTLGPSRRCIGSRAPGERELLPCPDGVIGVLQCKNCLDRTAIETCIRCKGDRCRNPIRRADCIQPENHAVYLAAYAHGVHKVGVARWTRREARLREQGARSALVIGCTDGLLARRFEARINETGVPDRWSSSEHALALALRAKPEEMLGELITLAQELRRRWPDEPWIEEFQPYLFGEAEKGGEKTSPWLPIARNGVGGEIIQVLGRSVFVRREDQTAGIIPLSSYIGWDFYPYKGEPMRYQRALPLL